MRRIALFLAVLAIMVVVLSCGNKNAQCVTQPEESQYTFTKEDTAEINYQVNQFIERLEQNDFRGAVELLNILGKGDSIKPLDAILQRRQAMALKIVKGVKYQVNRMILRSYTNNEVKLDITLFEKPENDPRPNMTAFFFRPVKFEGKWYLTVWDNMSNTNSDRNRD